MEDISESSRVPEQSLGGQKCSIHKAFFVTRLSCEQPAVLRQGSVQ